MKKLDLPEPLAPTVRGGCDNVSGRRGDSREESIGRARTDAVVGCREALEVDRVLVVLVAFDAEALDVHGDGRSEARAVVWLLLRSSEAESDGHAADTALYD